MSKTSKRATVIFGVVMVIAMALSVILPLVTTLTQSGTATAAEPVAAATEAAPTGPSTAAVDPATLTFDETVLHPSGMFSVGVPSGWASDPVRESANEVVSAFRNPAISSIAEVRVIEPEATDLSLETLDELVFTPSWEAATWSDYGSFRQAASKVEGDRLVSDYTLTQGSNTYIARQEAWVEDGRVFVTRVVTPEDGAALITRMLTGMQETLVFNQTYAGTPIAWNAYYDDTVPVLLRYPANWQVTDAAPGAQATIEGDGNILVVAPIVSAIPDEAAAADFVAAWRPGITVDAVEPLDQRGASGFRVAFSRETITGEVEHGAMVIINTEAGARLASIRGSGLGADMLTSDDPAAVTARAVLDTLSVDPALAASAISG
jgi:hypothetical protein